MSTPDLEAIGKLFIERRNAQRESERLMSQIKAANHLLYDANRALSLASPDIADALQQVDRLIASGGLDGLKTAMTTYQTLQVRIKELSGELSGTEDEAHRSGEKS